jgi:hypothetical protein
MSPGFLNGDLRVRRSSRENDLPDVIGRHVEQRCDDEHRVAVRRDETPIVLRRRHLNLFRAQPLDDSADLPP